MHFHKHLWALAGAVLVVSAASGTVRASLVNYSNVSSNGITISNITEDNNDNFAAGHYGQPVFSNGVLTFPSLQQFGVTESGGATSSFGDLHAKLTFTVTMPTATAALFNLAEQGVFAGYGGGNANIVLAAVVTDGNGNPVAITPSVGAIAPTVPPFVGLGPAQTTFTWQGSLTPVASTQLTTYTVVLDNDLSATAPAVSIQNPMTFADIEKKSLTISFPGGGSPPTPEPASLGILAIGSIGLLARRRRS
ncbi:MAG TPA: PEP-CTERM sorting domain-containing protein [Phycisphaerae bacterium]|jgi:hypothetical protein|nr:PEP-CTERM sorting domain-containing protein [Phycisphaerae bacterium]